MIILQPPQLDDLSACPYLPGLKKQFRYFFANQLNASEISFLLARGWRKFGIHYFQPVCPGCRRCIPLRVLAQEFKPSKSQRKILRKNHHVRVQFGPLTFTPRAFELYQDHSYNRFNQSADLEGFLFNFYTTSCPNLQSEFYIDDKLIGIGFLDVGADCLSSVYFVYDTNYTHLGVGTFSILQEIEYAKLLGLDYYYLGYYIAECSSMVYKDSFKPREHYDWHTGKWHRQTKK